MMGLVLIVLVVLGVVAVLVVLAREGLLPGTNTPIAGLLSEKHTPIAGLLTAAASSSALTIDIYDPAERQKLMSLSPAAQDAIVIDMMREIPELASHFAKANKFWNMFPGKVVATAQEAIPGVTRTEVAALVAAYRRIQRG